MTIVYRPLKDLLWTSVKRKSTLGWETCKVGETIMAFGSATQLKEQVFKSHVSRGLDWTWEFERRPNLDNGPNSKAWLCKRVS